MSKSQMMSEPARYPNWLRLGNELELCVRYGYLLELGFNTGTLDNFKQRDVRSFNLPADTRVSYFVWNEIPKPSREKVLIIIRERFNVNTPEQLYARQCAIENAKPTNAMLTHLMRKYPNDYDRYAKAAGLLLWVGSMTTRQDVYDNGFLNKEQVYEAALEAGRYYDLPKCTNDSTAKFRRFVTEFSKLCIDGFWKEALDKLDHGLKGKANRQVMTTEMIEYVETLYSNPGGKLSQPAMYAKLLMECVRQGWPQISPTCMRTWIDKTKNLTQIRRQGSSFAYNFAVPSAKREKPKAKNVLWVMDFTEMNRYYKGVKRVFNAAKQDYEERVTIYNRLWVGVIVDAATQLPIARVYGDETTEMVLNLCVSAMRKTQVRPREIMHDGSRGTGAAKDFLTKMARFDTKNQPYRARPKIVESFFGHYQLMIESKSNVGNWKGQNKGGKTQDNMPNPEVLDPKGKEFPTREELIQEYEQEFALWSELATPLREKPNYLWAKLPEGGIPVSEEEFVALTWCTSRAKYTYRSYGIMLNSRNKETPTYTAADDAELHLHLLGKQFRLLHDASDFGGDYVYLMDLDGNPFEWRGEHIHLERRDKLVMSLAEQNEDSRAKVQQHLRERKAADALHEGIIKKYEVLEEQFDLPTMPTARDIYAAAYERAANNMEHSTPETSLPITYYPTVTVKTDEELEQERIMAAYNAQFT